MNLGGGGGSKINIICVLDLAWSLLINNIVYSLSQQSTPWQIYYYIKKYIKRYAVTPKGTPQHKMHNFRNKARADLGGGGTGGRFPPLFQSGSPPFFEEIIPMILNFIIRLS